MKKFENLYDFIDRAVKSRKYPDNTGMALKTALRLFEAELKKEEHNSIDEFSKNIEQIYQSVFSKNKNFSAGSLATYKSRVTKVLADYEKYGADPTKMANWSPKVITRSKKTSVTKSLPAARNREDEVFGESTDMALAGMHRIELVLRPGVKSVIVVPMDINAVELTKIKAVLDSLSMPNNLSK